MFVFRCCDDPECHPSCAPTTRRGGVALRTATPSRTSGSGAKSAKCQSARFDGPVTSIDPAASNRNDTAPARSRERAARVRAPAASPGVPARRPGNIKITLAGIEARRFQSSFGCWHPSAWQPVRGAAPRPIAFTRSRYRGEQRGRRRRLRVRRNEAVTRWASNAPEWPHQLQNGPRPETPPHWV
jgi:hypothetical protein